MKMAQKSRKPSFISQPVDLGVGMRKQNAGTPSSVPAIKNPGSKGNRKPGMRKT